MPPSPPAHERDAKRQHAHNHNHSHPHPQTPAHDHLDRQALCEENKQVEELSEKQLQELLDEAVTYKRPKDREGKSVLFKNLLHEVEQEKEPQLGGSNSFFGASSGKRGRVKRSLTNIPHSSSLQDLAGAGSGPDLRFSRPHTRRRPVPVSARSFHGGSLPANVDQQYFGAFLEDVHCGTSVGIKPRISGNDYIATVKCINPPPLSEPNSTSDYMVLSVTNNESDRVSSSPVQVPVTNTSQSLSGYFDDDDGTEMDYIRPQKNSHIPSYTSRTTLEIVSPSMTGDTVADRNSNQLNLVDTNHGCITSPAISQPSSVLETKPLPLGASYCSVRSVTGSSSIEGNNSTNSGASSTFPVSSSGHLNVITNLQSQFSHDSDKKTFDENYNLSNTSSTAVTNQTNQKKWKRKKPYKNETQTRAELIDGYCGDKELDVIIRFIESDADNIKQQGKNQSKCSSGVGMNGKVTSNRDSKSKDDNDNEKSHKKRSIERRVKDKIETKLKKSNSMEELSHRKIDDFTSSKVSLTFRKSKKSSVFESSSNNSKNNERKSWCNDESESFSKTDNRNSDGDSTPIDSINTAVSVSKQKKCKSPATDIDTSLNDYDSFQFLETSDFQTVTKKKKVRKRHSPTDENRSKPSSYNNNNVHNIKPINCGRTNQDRDILYKRLGNGAHPSVSSPPSDKSNDSNDDLDSVHSLPADASGERFQASYADMARAAPPVSPPPSLPHINRQHNFPDLIESCNYYSNDVSIQEKNLDICVENTKNLLLKDNIVDHDKLKSNKTNTLDLGIQPDLNNHKPYTREQYPALESRQRTNKNVSKINKQQSHKNTIEKQNEDISKTDNKIKNENMVIGSIPTVNEDLTLEQYSNYSKNDASNVVSDNANTKINKISHLNTKSDNSSKPPDVVLPLTEINPSFDNRPAVIIMNDEPNRSSDDIHNINGITFGFDINEQLINGEINVELDRNNSVDYSDSGNNVEVSDSSCVLSYNSNIDFPPIDEKPYRESNIKSKISNEDSKHSKKLRSNTKEHAKLPGKNNSLDMDSQSATPSKVDDGNDKKENILQGETQVIETYIGKDKPLRYLAPTATSKDTYDLDRIVHYVGMAWENIIKSSGDKIRYFSDQQ